MKIGHWILIALGVFVLIYLLMKSSTKTATTQAQLPWWVSLMQGAGLMAGSYAGASTRNTSYPYAPGGGSNMPAGGYDVSGGRGANPGDVVSGGGTLYYDAAGEAYLDFGN